ncbi:MAG: hypothetical protein M3463_15685 [Verrucomicrobiota bacterium]|nr:hypothetical protein [Verrucomicrobiota bacterium]
MNFLRKLFGQTAPPASEKSPSPVPEACFATNAPSHWPPIPLRPLPHEQPQEPGQEAVNQIFFGARLSEAGYKGNADVSLDAFHYAWTTAEGFLQSPMVVKDRGRRVPVFVFPRADAAIARRWAGIQKQFRALGLEDPVYFAPEPLPSSEAEEAAIVRPFSLDLLRSEKNPLRGDYVMWAPDSEEPYFAGSASEQSWRRIYEALAGFQTYAFTELLVALELAPAQGQRVALPDSLRQHPVTGPGYRAMAVSASKEKGLRLHFHTETYPGAERRWVLKHFAAYCEDLRDELQKLGVERDPEQAHESPKAWFEFLAHVIGQKEKQESVSAIGMVQFKNEAAG